MQTIWIVIVLYGAVASLMLGVVYGLKHKKWMDPAFCAFFCGVFWPITIIAAIGAWFVREMGYKEQP